MLKLSSRICLMPRLMGLYVNTNGTLVLVLSSWLVGVDLRSDERGGDFSEMVVDKFIRVTTRQEVFLHLYGSVRKISNVRADPAESKKLTVWNRRLAVIRME